MSAAFLFGKLPAHGDFIARGLPAAERDAVDLWLAGSIADARAVLGDGFDDIYDRAQPWRFAVRGDDGSWSVGAMAPSVDGVGRRYPILLGIHGIADTNVGGMAAAVEGLLYAALAGGWDADRLVVAAAGIVVVAGERWTRTGGWWTVAADGTVAATVDGARPPALIRSLLTFGEGSA